MAMKSLKEMQETALDATKPRTVNPVEMLRLEALTSFEKYTKLMFKAQYKRSFIVAEHHKKIFEALQDVVDGKITRLIINIAPRYGKTELVIKSFISWCFALNPRISVTKFSILLRERPMSGICEALHKASQNVHPL